MATPKPQHRPRPPVEKTADDNLPTVTSVSIHNQNVDVGQANYVQQQISNKGAIDWNKAPDVKQVWDRRAQSELGYAPSFGQDPRAIAEAHRIIKATPEGGELPGWIANQKDQIVEAYNWHSFRNNGVPDTEWKWLDADDPAMGYLSSLQGPPSEEPEQSAFSNAEAVQQGMAGWTDIDPAERKLMLQDRNFDITQYPVGVRDQILNDPNFDWGRLPKWQKKYWEVMSNPAWMASPMALAGWRAGSMFGAPGKLVGAAAGYGLGYVGGQEYDPTGGVFEQPTTVAGMMAVLNKLSEGAEQTLGFTFQFSDAAIAGAQGNEQAAEAANRMLFDNDYREATWKAGMISHEAISDLIGANNWIPGLARLLGDEQAVLAGGGEDFIIGQASPVDREKVKAINPVTGNEYDVTDSLGILQEARKTLHKAIVDGASEEEVRDVLRGMLGEQGQYVGGQISDLVGQMVVDPLNELPVVTNRVNGKLASLLGNETAARAFTETRAPFEAARRYKTLVQSGDVPVSFDYQNMGTMARWVAGINEQGQIKAGGLTKQGLLDTPTNTKDAGVFTKLKEDWASMTPEARAREGASMFYNNVSAMLSTMDDPAQVHGFLKKLSNSDMKIWREMGSKIANSPEFYTVLPALKDFDANKVDGLVSSWEVAAPKRDSLMKIADVLGEEPGKFIDDLAKRGTAEQDFQRVMQRLQQSDSPQAKQLLEAAQRGEFTPASLADIVEAFTGEGALAWHPDQYKAQVIDALGSHFDEWTAKKLGLEGESKSTFFRTAHMLKSAQSVLLLGGSPGYALQNGLSGMLHRAATGNYGYLTPRQMDSWLGRFGIEPARIQEGVGIGGIVENARGKGKVQTSAIDKAARGDTRGVLGRTQTAISRIGKGMPFNKLSSWFESLEGKQGYVIAMRDMWSKTWRRGKGFAEATPELRGHLEAAGINPNHIYNLIEAGMSKAEIEQALFGKQQGMAVRSLVHDAAQKAGMDSSQAAQMLDKIGILDELDTLMRTANTPEKIRGAFRRATERARDHADMQTGRDLLALAEDVKNKVSTEGAPAALDVVQQVNGKYFDAWMDHYGRFGELFENLKEIPDLKVKNKAIDLAYKQSDAEFRRVYARTQANYQGIFESWGRSQNPDAMQILASISQQDAAMKSAYDRMRSIRSEYFKTYSDRPLGDLEAQAAWYEGQARVDEAFSQAFDSKTNAERAMGDAMGNLYDEMYGPAAGEAARKWWSDYSKFSADIVKREQKFRSSLSKLDKEQRAAAKAKYYGEDKVYQIAELEKINQEGIARLQKVIKKGGGAEGQGGIPTDPRQPQGPTPFDDVNQLVAEAEQRQAAEIAAKAQQVESVWEMAEQYERAGLPYDRSVLQDRFALLGALKKAEYNGIPDLKGLDDPRLTPDKVQEVMENRANAKAEAMDTKVQQAMATAGEAASTARIPKINENTTILRAISEHGGIRYDMAKEITGEARPKTAPGVFRKKGIGIDEMAIMLADDGYPIDLTRPDDPGGIGQTTDLINAARNGDKVYPMGHDHDATIRRAELEAAEKAFDAAMTEPEFDMALWQDDLNKAVQDGDLATMYERMGELPEEMGGQVRAYGETWNDYISRVADETAARVEQEARDYSIAEQMARSEDAMVNMEARGEAAMTRRLLEERFRDVFDLTDEQAIAYMELSDSVADWYARTTGESGDAFYSRYYEDVVSRDQPSAFGDEPFLEQSFVESGVDTPSAKGAVTFDHDGIKATIHAFEAKDISTLVHENAHVFRRMLSDVAARTDNQKVRADLATLEEWAGAKDGVWNRAAEEKFARGFEKYLADGQAPTPKLKRAFESFKGWMLQVYKQITGSEIDVKISEDVRAVFDRMLGDDEAWGSYSETNAAGNRLRDFGMGTPETTQVQGSTMIWRDGTGRAAGLIEMGDGGVSDLIVSARVGNQRAIVETLVEVASRATDIPIADLWDQVNKVETKTPLYQKFDISLNEENLSRQVGEVADSDFFKKLKRYKEGLGGEGTLYQQGNTNDFTKQMKQKYPNADIYMSEVNGRIVLDKIVLPEDARGQGTGTQFMSDLIAFADSQGKTISLTPDTSFGATSVNRLKDFYKNFGFVENKGRNKDFSHKDSMYRLAQEVDPNILFQNADHPFGTMDEASGFKADSEWMDEGWRQNVTDLLGAMEETAVERLGERSISDALTPGPSPDGRGGLSPEGQKMLRKYVNQVQNDLGAVKRSTMAWGESQRDFALLNYNRRYGFDKRLEVLAPYEFFYTRSLVTWGMRGLDKPSWFAHYARLLNMQNKHERDIPERLRNKIKIDAPWMPDWMGDALYIDPLANLFTPANFLRPFETMMRDKNYQVIETERILQQWAESGEVSQDEIMRAAQTQEGSLWERAAAEAAMRREAQIADPFDFMATMFGPAWYLSTPLNLLGVDVPFLSKGDPNKVSTTPLLNTTRALETVTKGSWAEPIGRLVGLIGKPEEMLREKQGLPEFGEYGDYYVDRQLTNMVADGLITSQQAQTAMIERQGELFDQARERVKMELAMRTPLAGTTYALTHEGLGAGAQAFLPSLFGSGLLPAGELEYRGLKDKWDAAWKQYDAGDKTAINDFFTDHPEYEAYLAKGKEPEEKLRSFMIGNIWDAYMELGETNQKAARAQMGEEFQQAFLNKETRSYDSIDVRTLTQWAQMLGTMLPRTEQTAPVIDQPSPQGLNLYTPEVTQIADKYFTDRKDNFKDYYFLERGYYSLPKSERTAYLQKFPRLKEYWDFKHSYYDRYPDLVDVFNGKVFKQVDTTYWPPALEDYVAMYAMAGTRLPQGAMKSLEQVWLREGQPYGDMQVWLDAQVVPAMLYQPGQ